MDVPSTGQSLALEAPPGWPAQACDGKAEAVPAQAALELGVSMWVGSSIQGNRVK